MNRNVRKSWLNSRSLAKKRINYIYYRIELNVCGEMIRCEEFGLTCIFNTYNVIGVPLAEFQLTNVKKRIITMILHN